MCLCAVCAGGGGALGHFLSREWGKGNEMSGGKQRQRKTEAEENRGRESNEVEGNR